MSQFLDDILRPILKERFETILEDKIKDGVKVTVEDYSEQQNAQDYEGLRELQERNEAISEQRSYEQDRRAREEARARENARERLREGWTNEEEQRDVRDKILDDLIYGREEDYREDNFREREIREEFNEERKGNREEILDDIQNGNYEGAAEKIRDEAITLLDELLDLDDLLENYNPINFGIEYENITGGTNCFETISSFSPREERKVLIDSITSNCREIEDPFDWNEIYPDIPDGSYPEGFPPTEEYSPDNLGFPDPTELEESPWNPLPEPNDPPPDPDNPPFPPEPTPKPLPIPAYVAGIYKYYGKRRGTYYSTVRGRPYPNPEDQGSWSNPPTWSNRFSFDPQHYDLVSTVERREGAGTYNTYDSFSKRRCMGYNYGFHFRIIAIDKFDSRNRRIMKHIYTRNSAGNCSYPWYPNDTTSYSDGLEIDMAVLIERDEFPFPGFDSDDSPSSGRDDRPIEEGVPEVDEQCCKAVLRLTRQLHEVVNPKQIKGSKIPKRWLSPGGRGLHEMDDIPDMLEAFYRMLDRYMGAFPFTADVPGGSSLKVHTISDALKQLLQLSIDIEMDVDRNGDIMIRAMDEVLMVHQLAVKLHCMIEGIVDYLDFDCVETTEKIKIRANPLSAIQNVSLQKNEERAEDVLRKYLKNSTLKVAVTKINPKSKESLTSELLEIKRACTLAAQSSSVSGKGDVFGKLLNAALMAEKLTRVLAQDGMDKDIDDIMDSIEDGHPTVSGGRLSDITQPYGKPFDERPWIREVDGKEDKNK